MTNPQKKIAEQFTQSLNAQIAVKGSALNDLLDDATGVIPEMLTRVLGKLLSSVTGGEGSILAARESDGTLVGFVPRSMVIALTPEDTTDSESNEVT